jgi:response regulator NasT
MNDIRVLIVDDDLLTANLTRVLLEREGYLVVGKATDGLEAIELTQTLQPDVILMDVNMPILNGIEATRRIQARCPTPVVMLSADSSARTTGLARAAGARAYLSKPVLPHELGQAIAAAVNGKMRERHQ